MYKSDIINKDKRIKEKHESATLTFQMQTRIR